MTTNWVYVIPEVELARHVPVLWIGPDGAYVDEPARAFVAKAPEPERPTALVFVEEIKDGARFSASELRVDLSEPQGMAYALRWLWKYKADVAGIMAVLRRHMGDATTDEDRLLVAYWMEETLNFIRAMQDVSKKHEGEKNE